MVRAVLVALAACSVTACTSSSPGPSPDRAAPPASATTSSSVTPLSAAPATSGAAPSADATAAARRPAHVVVVMLENHSYTDIIGNRSAPYLNSLARHGTLLTHSYAITHPSEPNYLALWSGSTHGLRSDACPVHYGGPTLGTQLRHVGLSFVGYSQSLPSASYTSCVSGNYARRHVPWLDFGRADAAASRPFTAFPSNFDRLPTLAFVVPNLQDDMHDGTIRQADTWLHRRLGAYATWARTHNSVLVITWDEDDRSAANHIPTIVVGQHIAVRHAATRVDHYRLLRTIEGWEGLGGIGLAAGRTPVPGIRR